MAHEIKVEIIDGVGNFVRKGDTQEIMVSLLTLVDNTIAEISENERSYKKLKRQVIKAMKNTTYNEALNAYTEGANS